MAKQLELVRELEVARLYGKKPSKDGCMMTEDQVVMSHPKYAQYMEMFGGELV